MAERPTVWLLLGRGVGGNGQMISLAKALGWPYEAKQLVFNRLSHCPNVLLGAAAITLDRHRSSPLHPPYPDLVIAGSRRSAPVARWIKKQSGGRTRLVHLMHTQAPLAGFDLIVTTPQYRLPARHNVLHNVGPLNHIDPARLAAAAAAGARRFAHLPRPFIGLLVGGNSSSYLLDPDTAARLGRLTSAQVRAAGGSVLVTTSARTPPAAAEALIAAIDCPADIYRWRADDPDNPYYAVLALADRFVVTADSASLLAEACATNKPVALFDWPLRADAYRGVKGLLRRWGELRYQQDGASARLRDRLYDRLVYLGLIKPARDFAAYHRALRQRGLITPLGESTALPLRQPLDDLARAVERVRALCRDGATCRESRDDLGPGVVVRDRGSIAEAARSRIDRGGGRKVDDEMQYLDAQQLDAIDAREFQSRQPYAWVNPAGLLTADGYDRLRDTLPDVSQFTRIFDVARKHGQQSHNRYALEYRPDLDVAAPWHDFIRELHGPVYRRFLARLLNRRLFSLRLHWHYTPNGCSISPHCDSRTKFGSHIFYFNTAADWHPAWGGQTLILDDAGQFHPKSAPRFEDFPNTITSDGLGNRSLLFARGEQSWHGMREIHCPPHAMRKVFIVVINAAVRTKTRDFVRRLRGGKAVERY